MAPFPSSRFAVWHPTTHEGLTIQLLSFSLLFVLFIKTYKILLQPIKVRFFIPPSIFNTFAITLNWYENKALKVSNINLWKIQYYNKKNWFFQEIFHSYVNILERVQKPWQKMLIIWIMFWQPLTFNSTH